MPETTDSTPETSPPAETGDAAKTDDAAEAGAPQTSNAKMNAEFLIAIKQLTTEKALPEDVVFEAVETAMAAAFKRDYDLPGNVFVKIAREEGEMEVFSEQEVVEIEEDIADEDLQIELERARKEDATAAIGGVLRREHSIPQAGGRIAAQTAKQVVLQRLREAEREAVFSEYSGQEGEIVSGLIQRVEPRQVIIDLGRTEAVLPGSEQVRMEHYRSGQRLKAFVIEVLQANKGPQIVVSRRHKDFVRRLFELEVPEIQRGQVEIRSIAREPGHRTKIAVHSRQEGLDPVGACVGMRAIRIQNVVNELHGERIDVIQWDPDPRRFVAHAVSPAQVAAVRIDPETNTAEIAVPDAQMSLAIGREGQNARLAARLTKLRIDIKPQTVAEEMQEQGVGPYAPQPELTIPEEEPEPVPVTPPPGAEAEEAGVAQPAQDSETEPEAAPAAGEVEEEPEEELEPAMAATEVAPAPTEPGQIRFAEDVLRREQGDDDAARRRRRRPRYVETEEGLEEDPYAAYEDEF